MGVHLVCPKAPWGLSSPTGDGTRDPCMGRWVLNLWTTREALRELIESVFIILWFFMIPITLLESEVPLPVTGLCLVLSRCHTTVSPLVFPDLS